MSAPTISKAQKKALNTLRVVEDFFPGKKIEDKVAGAALQTFLHRDVAPSEVHALEKTSASKRVKSLTSNPEVQALAQANGASQALLGKTDPSLYPQARALSTQGKSTTEIRSTLEDTIKNGVAYRHMHMADTVTAAYQSQLQRAPTSDEKLAGVGQVKSLIDQGKSVADTDAALTTQLQTTPDYRKLHAADNVNGVYAFTLGRAPNADELSKGVDAVKTLIDQGKSNDDINKGLSYGLMLSPEWQAKHPSMNTDRNAIYIQQPTGWTCGPTSLAMAMAAAGKRPANLDTVWEMAGADKLNTIANHSTDKMPDQIADIAKGMGVNAVGHAGASEGDMRAALAAGHGIMVNVKEPDTGGHFVYIAGLDGNGQMIVCDPWHPETPTWSDDTLSQWSRAAPGAGNFVEFWPQPS